MPHRLVLCRSDRTNQTFWNLPTTLVALIIDVYLTWVAVKRQLLKRMGSDIRSLSLRPVKTIETRILEYRMIEGSLHFDEFLLGPSTYRIYSPPKEFDPQDNDRRIQIRARGHIFKFYLGREFQIIGFRDPESGSTDLHATPTVLIDPSQIGDKIAEYELSKFVDQFHSTKTGLLEINPANMTLGRRLARCMDDIEPMDCRLSRFGSRNTESIDSRVSVILNLLELITSRSDTILTNVTSTRKT
jgi:hypothetical protein